VGAGYRRGANLGPQAIRGALLDGDRTGRAAPRPGSSTSGMSSAYRSCCDDMLSEVGSSQPAGLYPDVAPEIAATLPVSPLSIAERALDRC
jgi:agmatinase